MHLDKYIKENGPSTDFKIFENRISVNVDLSTNDLFLAQYNDGEFNAVDVIVKYLAIESYFGLNNYGFSLYKKMQEKRIGENWNDRFKNLIQSVEKNGYLNNFTIETDINYSIHDGAHRLALAMFFNIPYVSVKTFNADKKRRTYNIDWFKENGFSEEEIYYINAKEQELLERCRTPYYCVFWPPARKIFIPLTIGIEQVEEGIHVIGKQNLLLPRSKFQKFIYDIYKTDDILPEKLNLKYSYLMNSLNKDNISDDNLPVHVLQVKIDNPDFRMKTFTGLPQSKTTMRVKKTLRSDFSDQITDYYYDILMHMTDNSIQNVDVENILKRIK